MKMFKSQRSILYNAISCQALHNPAAPFPDKLSYTIVNWLQYEHALNKEGFGECEKG